MPRMLVRVAKSTIGRLDQTLRHRLGIFEFSRNPECILRAEFVRSNSRAKLSDGIIIKPDDPVLELHLWNEHLPHMGRHGCTVAWARRVSRGMQLSLAELAAYVSANPDAADVKAIHGRFAFSLRQGLRQLDRLGNRYGFDVFNDHRPTTLDDRMHDIGENILFWMILWTYNPASIRYNHFLRRRREVWMSRESLLRNYGSHLGAQCSGPSGTVGQRFDEYAVVRGKFSSAGLAAE
ncbi:MAG: hypothetical protein KGJ66_12750 [Alphaproteobacteria bacterium]|nr:hypothetical protein [Alphaproteobacteria bacterium]